METREQRESQATLLQALHRRGQAADAVPSPPPRRDLIGRKKDGAAWQLEVNRIRPDEDQVRRQGKAADDEATQQLAESIREHGLLHPIDVRWVEADDIYEIISGERRFTAVSQILGWTEVPVRIIDVPSEQIVWLQLHENIHRKDLHPLDLAYAVQQAIDGGMTLEHVAAKLQKSKTYVQKALTVARELTDEAERTLRGSKQGESLETAYEVATLPATEQAAVATQVVVEKLNQQQLRSVAAKTRRQGRGTESRKGGRPTKAKPYSRSFATSIGGRVTVNFRKANVTPDEVRAALQEALDALGEDQGRQRVA